MRLAILAVISLVAFPPPAKAKSKPVAQDARVRVIAPLRGWLSKIRYCESRGNYRAVSADGRYRGAYQFDIRTWRSVGGKGDPAAASRREQDYRAALLFKRRGPQPWPVCGR